jgi:hypothetical protein
MSERRILLGQSHNVIEKIAVFLSVCGVTLRYDENFPLNVV